MTDSIIKQTKKDRKWLQFVLGLLVILLVAFYFSGQRNAAIAREQACERGNALRALAGKLTEVELQHLDTTSIYATANEVRKDSQALSNELRSFASDPRYAPLLEERDCGNSSVSTTP